MPPAGALFLYEAAVPTTVSAADLELLRKYDTPTICNVVELSTSRRTAGYLDGRLQACYPKLPPMVGFAARPRFAPPPPRLGNVYGSLDQQARCV